MRRSRRLIEEPKYSEPDMLPILNICLMLILALISLSAFLPLGFITANAPKLSNATVKSSHKPDVNLTLLILDEGFQIVIDGKKQKLMPKIESPNHGYNFVELNEELALFKQLYPKHREIYIAASQDVKYVDIIHAMDASRVNSVGKSLFPNVAFAAGMTE